MLEFFENLFLFNVAWIAIETASIWSITRPIPMIICGTWHFWLENK